MLHQDYIMKMLMDLATAVMRTITLQSTQKDPEEAARSLEEAVGQAVALDGGAFLALAPDSIAQIMQVMGTDPGVSIRGSVHPARLGLSGRSGECGTGYPSTGSGQSHCGGLWA